MDEQPRAFAQEANYEEKINKEIKAKVAIELLYYVETSNILSSTDMALSVSEVNASEKINMK